LTATKSDVYTLARLGGVSQVAILIDESKPPS